MPPFLRDKYFLLCVTVACLIIVNITILNNENQSAGQIGIVYGIHITDSGCTCYLEETSGNITYCFSRDLPTEGQLYRANGSYSDDNSIFFISTLCELSIE